MCAKTLFSGGITLLFLLSALSTSTQSYLNYTQDIDPLVDLSLNITIQRIRTLDIELGNPPTLSAMVEVGKDKWESKKVQGFDIHNVGTVTSDIPDNQEYVLIIFEVYKNGTQADINGNSVNFEVIYHVPTGTWGGDDSRKDITGYGHTSGYDTYHIEDNDCELWFDISFNDYDGDGLTYWEEVNIYGTNPTENDWGRDDDNDSVPIEWEDHWGYDPFIADNHSLLDPDQDGLQNIEEYYMWEWYADPFRQDIYIENDYVAPHNGIETIMPMESLQLQYSAFSKQNIMLLIDDGLMGGSDQIPYETLDDRDACENLYTTYFLHNNNSHPRKGIFHYALIIHEYTGFGRGVGGFNYKRDAFAIASAYIQKWRPWEEGSIIGHGGSYMHELGHQLGLPHLKVFPFQLRYWLSTSFKSCMNYRYNFKIVDFSDGTHGLLDYDEWSVINLERFQQG